MKHRFVKYADTQLVAVANKAFSLGLALMWSLATVAHAADLDAVAVVRASGVRGGLVAHLGATDGALTAALRVNDRYLVHGVTVDAALTDPARSSIDSLGLSDKVSISTLSGNRLPFIDNGVNLLVALELGNVSVNEVIRVLSPNGVALIRTLDNAGASVEMTTIQIGSERWSKLVKPRPAAIDEWTHFLHGADNNAVAHDKGVAAPRHAQWIGAPKWARHHNYLSSTSAVVTTGGRIFAIIDEGPTASMGQPPQWHLSARDAFSGVLLWKRPIGPWEGTLRPFRSGPREMARRLVAVGDRVFVTLGYNKPVTALDAATGETVRTYSETDGAVEILCDAGTLYVVIGQIDPAAYDAALRRGGPSPAPHVQALLAVDADSGRVLWRKDDADAKTIMPTTLASSGDNVYFQNADNIYCLAKADGSTVWKISRPVRLERLAWSAPSLVIHKDVVLSADCSSHRNTSGRTVSLPDALSWKVTARPKRDDDSMGELIAFSARDGKELWRCPTAQGYNVPPDIFVAGGLVWSSVVPNLTSADFSEGRDLHTGEVKRRLDTEAAFTVTHHHRCYRDKATDDFILLGRTGVEFIDLNGGPQQRNCWVRGACQYGVLPANGLLYAPPHACACYIQSKLSGFWALAPARPVEASSIDNSTPRTQRGPAFGNVASNVGVSNNPADEWPIHRHDVARTGRTKSGVPSDLQIAWSTSVGGRLTAPIVSGKRVIVASSDTHAVQALDADSGRLLWRRLLGGRIDSTPTVYKGMVIGGCADGYVYCLRLADGELVWRFRAAQTDRRLVSFDQVESVWPVTGSVLVLDDVVYCTAGRSSFLDGGMTLCRLDAATGRLLSEKVFDSLDPKTGGEREEIIDDVELPGALPDILVYDGKHLYLRDNVLDLNGERQDGYVSHLYCSAGLLDDEWWHRTYWMWAERTWGRASGWSVMAGIRPSGRILVTDSDTLYGYGRKRVQGNSLQGYHLFQAAKDVKPIDKRLKNNNVALSRLQKPAKVTTYWSKTVSCVVRGLVMANNRLFAAGPVMAVDNGAEEPAFDRSAPSLLMVVNTDDGSELAQLPLPDQPVFDGLSAAYHRLYVATVGGDILCLSGK